MKKSFLVILLLLISIQTQAQTEKELISKALMDYIDGTGNGSPDQIKRAFHPDLNLYSVKNGAVAALPGKKYVTFFQEGRKTGRVGSITSIDYTNNAAIAKVKITSGNRVFTDYMMLLKVAGTWKIIHKSYTFRNAGDKNVKTKAEENAVKKALSDYINGSTGGKPNLLKEVFHPDLNLYYVSKGALKVWPGVDYIKDTKEGQPTGESGKILSIDYENNAAIGKVEISSPNNKIPYIDYFILLKVNEKWTIIHKMFTKKTS